jgi:proteasome lid subunit RPN8/RPN11
MVKNKLENENSDEDTIKEAIKKRIKEKIKKELLEEIYNELKLEEDELAEEISSSLSKNVNQPPTESLISKDLIDEIETEQIEANGLKENKTVTISVKAILKIASHALKYANPKISKDKWVEVIGLLAGKQYDYGPKLHIEDAYPMGHGTAVYAEIKDYKNFVRAFNDIKSKELFICGWYHSHPSYGTWMSDEDIGTQARYQKLWDQAIALVVDPYQIDGTSLGIEIFRADLKTKKWFTIPFSVEGSLDIKMLPEILDFMNPIIEGKAVYLEYDED